MVENVLKRKSFGFAVRMVNLFKYLKDHKKEFVLSKQILRSGTSKGALVKKAEQAQSKADFINKMNIALKKANETEYWLMLLNDSEYFDCSELTKPLASIVKTSKENNGK